MGEPRRLLSRYAVLHTSLFFPMLWDVLAVVMAVAALAMADPMLAVASAVMCGALVGQMEREVRRCRFALVLPGHAESVRHLFARIAATYGAFTATTSAVAVLPDRGLSGVPAVLAGAASGAAGWLVGAVAGMYLALTPVVAVIVWGQVPRGSEPFVRHPAAVLACCILAVVFAWRRLDPRRSVRWFGAREVILSVGPRRDPRASAMHARVWSARLARRWEPFGTWLVDRMRSPGWSRRLRGVLGVLVPWIGGYPVGHVLAAVTGLVVLVVMARRHDPYGSATIAFYGSCVPLIASHRVRLNVMLPLGRSALLRQHLFRLGSAVAVAVLLLVAADGMARLLGVSGFQVGRLDARSEWGVVVTFSSIVATLAAVIDSRFVAGLLIVLVLLFESLLGPALRDAGIVVTVVVCLAAIASCLAILRAYYALADLAPAPVR